MKTKENEFFIDIVYSKYQSLSKKDKFSINLSFIILLAILAINYIYKAGELFGEFLYYINH